MSTITAGPPATLSVCPEALPPDLAERRQWVCWQWAYRPTARKPWTKPPINPCSGMKASVTDPTTWGDLASALATARRNNLPGVGFVLTPDDPYTVVDLDRCRDPRTGVLSPEAAAIVAALDSYADASPSGTGVHVLVEGLLPSGTGRRHGEIEVYSAGRYITMTGHRLPNGPVDIQPRQEALEQLCTKIFGWQGHHDATANGQRPPDSPAMSDANVIAHARDAANGHRFDALFNGDTSGHGGDDSAADLALLSMLAFWTQDRAQLDRLFRRSGLYREKWERADYRQRTVARALTRSEVYHPGPGVMVNGNGPRTGSPDETDDGGASGQADERDGEPNEHPPKKTTSQGALLVRLAIDAGVELFHDDAGESFATFDVDGHHETWPLRRGPFRNYLLRLFYRERHGAVPGAQAQQDALGMLEARARYDGEEWPVFLRTAPLPDGGICIDLGDAAWRAARVDADGWKVIADPPVRFRRSVTMRALPEPRQGGAIDKLWDYVNLASDDDRLLFLLWLVKALTPGGPYPILDLAGEQGGGKTTIGRVGRALTDPRAPALVSAPREERDLYSAATNGRVLALDNLSTIPPWQADALCRLATGGGWSARKLYTDDDEHAIDVTVPIVLTGIPDLATRPDLADRTIALTVPRIPPDRRVDESRFWKHFEADAPAIFVALLDILSAALRNLPATDPAELPRMADFARLGEAAAPVLGKPAGTVLAAMCRNHQNLNAVILESYPVAAAVLALMAHRADWQGTASALLVQLNERVDQEVKRGQGWPKAPHILAGQLRRLAPNLRHAGFDVTFVRGGDTGERRIIVTRAEVETKGEQAAGASDASAGP